MKRRILFAVVAAAMLSCCWAGAVAQQQLRAGVGKSDITPPVGTPLAGYGARLGRASTGVRDPTEARALVIDNGVERIALVAVDHLGFDHQMVRQVRELAARSGDIDPTRVFVMSSHTHCGGGAYLEPFPVLAGRYDPGVRAHYEERAAQAVVIAARNLRPARIGFGSGEARGISRFRSSWPPDGPVDPEVGVIRVDSVESGKQIALLFNFAAHPTVLGATVFEFSADFVGYARNALERMTGDGAMALFANGAQGTIAPHPPPGRDDWEKARLMGSFLAAEAFKVSLVVKPQDWVDIKLVSSRLALTPQPPPSFPSGMAFPLPAKYQSEMSAISFDRRVAFVTIPGELSSILNDQVKNRGRLLGFENTYLLGLTNDAVGYILTEDEYRHRTYESTISLFGPGFGSLITNEAFQLLERLRPVEKKK
jgi:hypothetical protein